MPIYEYRCSCGKTQEKTYSMDSFPRTIKCGCGKRAVKLCTAGGFHLPNERAPGIRDDHPAWIKDTANVLVDPEMVYRKQAPRIESRSGLRRYLKERNLAMGDECDPRPAKVEDTPISPEAREQGIKAVAEVMQKERAITVGKLGTPA